MTEFVVGIIIGLFIYHTYLKRRQRLFFTTTSGRYSVGITDINQETNIITLGLDYRSEDA